MSRRSLKFVLGMLTVGALALGYQSAASAKTDGHCDYLPEWGMCVGNPCGGFIDPTHQCVIHEQHCDCVPKLPGGGRP